MSNTSLYTILALPVTTSQEEIKRTYRKLALQLHPDKNPDPEAAGRFRDVNKAYKILSHKKKRKIYDKYGETGLALLEAYGHNSIFLDILSSQAKVYSILGFISLTIAFVFAFLIMVGLKYNHADIYRWRHCVIPLFLIKINIIIGLYYKKFGLKRDEDHEHSEGEHEQPLHTKIVKFIVSICKILLLGFFEAMLALKAENTRRISWIVLWVPFLAFECIDFFQKLSKLSDIEAAYDKLKREKGILPSKKARFYAVFSLYKFNNLRLFTIILILWKIDNIVHMTWTTAFLPLLIMAFVIPLWFLIWDLAKFARMKKQPDGNSENRSFVILKLILDVFVVMVIYLTAALFLVCLSSPDFNFFYVCIPSFIVLSILFLCSCCCLPILFSLPRTAPDEETGIQAFIKEIIEAPNRKRILDVPCNVTKISPTPLHRNSTRRKRERALPPIPTRTTSVQRH
ncbi:DnaJ-domain-containing protein [Rozella allomycis CSF55]|uniref:DnaJ-domain-containing protein n=1 Tax=Rozella allomycis (strain CSF55) TaxID=988480 RepID=A0A4V1IZ60_ROZAC|nr:DnaJ-domain-containing protein [Rozella allomycis CSF55]